MAGINRAKISAKIYKQLEKKDLLKEVNILRTQTNAYKEKMNDLYVCTIKGYYHREESKVESDSVESATINKLYNDKFLVVYDDTSIKINKDDYFMLDSTQYKIIDLGNVENIIFDMYLSRM